MKILILLTCLFTFNCIFCQPSFPASKTDSLLLEISRLQIKGKSFYDKGQFPVQRGKHKRVEDNTVFFSALISLTLQNVAKDMDSIAKKRVDTICNQIRLNYISYQNRSGNKTFNFWKTTPPDFFPHSKLLSHFSIFNIPDDADCTSIIYLTDTSLRNNATWLQNKLAMHSNLSTQKIKNTNPSYQHFKAYSTWFGKKMPIEFDICVQSNVLFFIYKNHLPLTIQDQETLALLHAQIISGEYLKQAYYCSPSYKKPAIVLYHLARLLENNQIPLLEDCREIIRKDMETELKKASIFMDKIILSTSLLRMKRNPPPINLKDATPALLDDYAFFRANLFSSYARPSLKFISKSSWLDCCFYCRAYCLSLLLEYETMSVRNNPSVD
jgi:hypothetical protein